MSESENALLVGTDNVEKVVKHDRGEVTVRHRRITRFMRNKALEKAALAYKAENPDDKEGGFLPTVFEEEMVRQALVWWSLPTPPKIGWLLLPADSDVGEKIVEALGINDVLAALTGKGKEVEKAKNSSSAETPVASIPS